MRVPADALPGASADLVRDFDRAGRLLASDEPIGRLAERWGVTREEMRRFLDVIAMSFSQAQSRAGWAPSQAMAFAFAVGAEMAEVRTSVQAAQGDGAGGRHDGHGHDRDRQPGASEDLRGVVGEEDGDGAQDG